MLRSCWIFLTTVVTLSCVASVCFTYFVKWANTTTTNFLVALIYILTNAFCLWSIGCNCLSPSHWRCYCGGDQLQRWTWNCIDELCQLVRAEMWDTNQTHSKSGSVKSQWVDINLLYLCSHTLYYMFVPFTVKDRLISRYGTRSIIEFFLLTLWFHSIRRLAIPRSLLLQTLTMFSFILSMSMSNPPWSLMILIYTIHIYIYIYI